MRYCVEFLVIDSRFYDDTEAGYQRALNRAKRIHLHEVTDIEAALQEYRKKFPADRYDIDDIKWREEK